MTVESLAMNEDLDGAIEACDHLKSQMDDLILDLAKLRCDRVKFTVAADFS